MWIIATGKPLIMESVNTQGKYATVTTRFLSNTEKRYQSGDAKIPLVIEPKPGLQKTSFLCEFLSSHSESVVQAIYEHGAVLFRGFEVANGEELTQVMSHAGMPGMGPRSLVTTLYNPIPLNLGTVGSGVADIPSQNPAYVPVGTRFAQAGSESSKTSSVSF
ncbi:MAG: hypothetical protein ACI9JM_002269 [Halioglobus sp.]|jgi:hypothetical protein